jgi:hypothetical protein
LIYPSARRTTPGSLYELESAFGRRFDDHGSGMGGEDAGYCNVPLDQLEHMIEVCKSNKLHYTVTLRDGEDDYDFFSLHTSLFKHERISRDTCGADCLSWTGVRKKPKRERQYFWKHMLNSSWMFFRKQITWLHTNGEQLWDWQEGRRKECVP